MCFKKIYILFICIVFFLYAALPFSGFATSESQEQVSTTTTTSAAAKTTTTRKATTTASRTTTKRVTQKTTTSYRSVKFKSSNTNIVEKLKSITLTIETTGIQYLDTKFRSEDTTIASVEKINNTNVRVVGLREGSVNIEAVCGGVSAKFKIIVRDSNAEGGLNVESEPENVLETASGGPVVSELDLSGVVVSQEDIFENLEYPKTNPLTIVLGIVAWGIIFIGIALFVTLIFRNRTPRFNRFPGGSRKRYGKHHRRSNRLLPDHYYRNIKKW